VPTSRATRVTSPEPVELIHHGVEVSFSLAGFAAALSTVILRERSPPAMEGPDFSAILRTWAVRLPRHRIDAVGQVFPVPAHAGHLGLTASLPSGTDSTRRTRVTSPAKAC